MEHVSASDRHHLPEHADFLPFHRVGGTGGKPLSAGERVQDQAHHGGVAAGHHQFRYPVSGEVVRPYHHFSAAAFQRGSVHAHVAIFYSYLEGFAVGLEFQRTGPAVKIVLQAKDEGPGGVVGVGAGLRGAQQAKDGPYKGK